MDTRWKKGQSGNPKGRPKGAKDKFTDLKTSFLDVYKRMGGDDALLKWATKDNQNMSTFYLMLKTMLPKEIQSEVRNDIRITWGPVDQIPDAEVITPELGAPQAPDNTTDTE